MRLGYIPLLAVRGHLRFSACLFGSFHFKGSVTHTALFGQMPVRSGLKINGKYKERTSSCWMQGYMTDHSATESCILRRLDKIGASNS